MRYNFYYYVYSLILDTMIISVMHKYNILEVLYKCNMYMLYVYRYMCVCAWDSL